jgi:hypothetical protein
VRLRSIFLTLEETVVNGGLFCGVYRIVCRMNLTHTVQDIRNFINASVYCVTPPRYPSADPLPIVPVWKTQPDHTLSVRLFRIRPSMTTLRRFRVLGWSIVLWSRDGFDYVLEGLSSISWCIKNKTSYMYNLYPQCQFVLRDSSIYSVGIRSH